ncbi:hypothetical protein IMCC3317_34540 [Kordia antarctica]|uniref:Uncharacterized protein n=1 Tax=Kordia antarctica TaxID=1218801 RepID=A0A7L4ZNJ6_9FLAO|nr:hypothetical protein [Kordia antarctica]QHI38070.1 hypothetical protein IMCC3317_34540 [Kordia antarctica]
MEHTNIVDVLLQNITDDQELLKGIEQKIDDAKEEKKDVQERIKGYHKDASAMMKYASAEQIAKIEALDINVSESKQGLNSVATTTFDIMMNTKKKLMTNGELYQAYVDSLDDKEKAVKYTEFNIKCRPLFNNQRLIRTKGSDPKSSRTDVITLNGSSKAAIKKETTKKK